MKTLNSLLIIIGSLTLTQAGAATFQEDMDGLRQATLNAGHGLERLLDFQDPFKGESKFLLPQSHAPWAGNYFPMAKGGLATRWQTSTAASPSTLPTKEEVLKMSRSQLARLSPIEKYDIYVGDYSFSATRHELFNRGPQRSAAPEIWEGFCNGVRCAGIHLPEPKYPISKTNPDGVKVIFEPADLKALAGASYFFVEQYSQIGGPSRADSFGANRPHPAVWDMALRFFLAEKKSSFMVDSNLGSEIWNESVVGFERKLQGPFALSEQEKVNFAGATSKVVVQSELLTLGEISIDKSNGSTTKKVARGKLHKSMAMEYTLFLDQNNRAIDGTWGQAANARGVDWAWFSAGAGTDSQYPEQNGNKFLKFEAIKDMVKQSHSPVSLFCRLALRWF